MKTARHVLPRCPAVQPWVPGKGDAGDAGDTDRAHGARAGRHHVLGFTPAGISTGSVH